jgi:isopenicillin-N N-acyltransferase-like protein
LPTTKIGLRHGQAAREIVLRSIDFYKAYYVEMSRLEWPDAIEAALKFMPLLESDWPDFVSEMRGLSSFNKHS